MGEDKHSIIGVKNPSKLCRRLEGDECCLGGDVGEVGSWVGRTESSGGRDSEGCTFKWQ